MIDYKKKYLDALERANSFQEKYGGDYAGYIFPELRESEDERIRKFLVDYFASYKIGNVTTKLNGVRIDDILNYLKKQKDQKPEHFELKAGKWYICHRAFCCRADHLTVKEGERFMCEKDGVVKGFIIKEPEKYFIECSAPAPMGDEQKEQNPVEWSEEDEDMLNSCISSIEEAKENRYAYKETDGDTSYDHEIAWLKSLRRPKSSDNWKPVSDCHDLEEAAEEWCKTNNKGIALCADKKSHYLAEGIDAFKAGAEWQKAKMMKEGGECL